MKKTFLAVTVAVLVMACSSISNAQVTNNPAPKTAPKAADVTSSAVNANKTYSKLTEAKYVSISAELRTTSIFPKNAKKPITPQERMGQIDKIFNKYNVSKDDFRLYSIDLRKDPKRFQSVNKKIDAATKALMK